MQGKHLFEYAIIRVVPKVEREEFLNVGLLVFCPAQQFLGMTFALDEKRLQLFSNTLDLAEVKKRLCAFERICVGGKEGGAIGQLSMASRFRWLTANRSTILQTSSVHPGFCEDAAHILAKLHTQLVL